MKFVVVFVVIIAAAVTANEANTTDENLIKNINEAQNLWIAKPNEITKRGISYVKDLLGAEIPENKTRQYSAMNFRTLPNIPESFDARKEWPQCQSISSVKDQGRCGSCWAVSTASAASDRICIKSGFKTKINLSATYLMSCCPFCHPPGLDGCQGGNTARAWLFYIRNGIVSGGDYGSREGCQPYDVMPSYTRSGADHVARCYRMCTNREYSKPLFMDKYYGETAYILPNSEAIIQTEIMKNGPVVASYIVYADFIYYSSGVYSRTSSERLEGHAVRVIGWGVEKGVKYWLAVNTWSRRWGDNGTFKIRRGTNECEFESYVTAAVPDLNKKN